MSRTLCRIGRNVAERFVEDLIVGSPVIYSDIAIIPVMRSQCFDGLRGRDSKSRQQKAECRVKEVNKSHDNSNEWAIPTGFSVR